MQSFSRVRNISKRHGSCKSLCLGVGSFYSARRAFTSLQSNEVPHKNSKEDTFQLFPSRRWGRVSYARFPAKTVESFLDATKEWPIQALEYKPFLRYQVAHLLNEICGGSLRALLLDIMMDRSKGALVASPELFTDVSQADDMVKFSTAVSHLLGGSNFDAMSQKYYARFVVKNVDSSDSYLRQAQRVMELHNDGTFVEDKTDYVLMMKIDECHVKGGNSLILHLDDWHDLDRFRNNELATKPFRWSSPPSKNTSKDVYHPVFGVDDLGRPTMSYIDQFVQPSSLEEGTWLFQLGESLESSDAKVSIGLPVGTMLIVNNSFWLHSRDKFEPDPNLHRELMRQRGYFSAPSRR